MNEIKVSIVAITHNQESLIERALLSLVKQDFILPYEIIVVNDASSDLTGSVINNLIKDYAIIKTINVNCQSAGLARVEGIKISSGKYITFLDCDDYYAPNMVSTLYNTIEKEQADIVNCSHYYIRHSKIKRNPWTKDIILDRNGAIDALFSDVYFHGFMWAKMFKGEIIRSIDFHLPKENIMFEDILMSFETLLKCTKIVSISTPLYYYNKNNRDSITSTVKGRAQNNVDVFASIRYEIDLIDDLKLKDIWRKHHIRRKFSIIADAYIDRSNNNLFKTVKISFAQLKELNSKNKINISAYIFNDFVKKCFRML